jgi:hypothetical protein
MGDEGDFWRAVREARQAKRRANTMSSTQMLQEAGVTFESKNGGTHLVVSALGHVIDFWPSSGVWIMRGSPQRHRGVRKLIQFCKPAGESSSERGAAP